MEKTIEQKKSELRDQLLVEMIRLAKQGRSVFDHKRAIEYLNTGNEFDGKGEILEACIIDFEMMYRDYCVL